MEQGAVAVIEAYSWIEPRGRYSPLRNAEPRAWRGRRRVGFRWRRE